jgi:hypothetical protein
LRKAEESAPAKFDRRGERCHWQVTKRCRISRSSSGAFATSEIRSISSYDILQVGSPFCALPYNVATWRRRLAWAGTDKGYNIGPPCRRTARRRANDIIAPRFVSYRITSESSSRRREFEQREPKAIFQTTAEPAEATAR